MRPTLPLLLVGLVAGDLSGQQVPDTAFLPVLESPSYERGAGPRVAIDEAHLNLHTASGGFLAFARLLERDGYRVSAHGERFTAASLADVDVLVVANALHPESSPWG